MKRELRAIIIGLCVIFVGTLGAPAAVLLLPIPHWIGLLAAVLITGVGLWLLISAFLRYRWIEFMEFSRYAKDVFLPKGTN